MRTLDVSFSARSPAGIHPWDVLHTLIGTASLLKVNVPHFFQDRCARACYIPPRADLIRQSTAQATVLLPAAAQCQVLSRYKGLTGQERRRRR